MTLKLKKSVKQIIRQKKDYSVPTNITVPASLKEDFEEFQNEVQSFTGLKFTFSEVCREGVYLFMQRWRSQLKKALKGQLKTSPKVKKRKYILTKNNTPRS